MARQPINRGTIANDGTGDTLRTAAGKVNDNFVELYLAIGGDSDTISSKVQFVDSGLSFEGIVDDSFETILTPIEPTADRYIKMPNATGTIILDSDTQTLTNKTLTSPVLTTPQINDTSANHQYIVAVSELAADRNVTLPLLGGDDEFTFNAHTQTLTNKTLTAPITTNPIVGGKNLGGFIQDSAGNELIEFDRVASAVNHIKISNNSTGLNPKIEAVGETNVDLDLAAKGSGMVEVNTRFGLSAETVTSSANLDMNKALTIFNVTSGTITPTLGGGQNVGELHYFISKGAGTVQLDTNELLASSLDSAGAYFQFNQQGTLVLQWDGSAWHYMSSRDSAGGSGTVNLI